MRKIIHVDMDAFFAQVEMRDNPEYQGKPIVIGSGNPQYGVVSTCSYEARKYGVRSAMPNIKAYKLCPHAIFVRQNNVKYREASRLIHNVFHEVTDIVEGLSLDEAYLDVTTNKLNIESATEVATYIKKRIYEETHLTCSAGVSYNKLLAKLGSDYNKPNGLTVITPKRTNDFLQSISLRDIPGIGKSAQSKMEILGIFTIEDLKALSRDECIKYFNSHGSTLYEYVRGIDNREVIPFRERKSIGHETTLKKPYENIFDSEPLLNKFLASSLASMQKKKIYAKTFSVKIKYGDFTQYTRSISLDYYSNTYIDFSKHVHALLLKFPFQNKQIRLIGISFSSLADEKTYSSQSKKQSTIQTSLF